MVTPLSPLINNDGTKHSLALIDSLILSGRKITFAGEDFKDDRFVGKFLSERRTLKTAMLATNVFMYIDPCHCCIPGHGERNYKPNPIDATGLIRYIREANESDHPLDLVFTSLTLYEQCKEEIEKNSPQTKLIVGCDRISGLSASELRRKGIPAVDDNDYYNCSPLNAVIAFVVFGEVVDV